MRDKNVEIEKVLNGYLVHYRYGDLRRGRVTDRTKVYTRVTDHTKVYTDLFDATNDVRNFMEDE